MHMILDSTQHARELLVCVCVSVFVSVVYSFRVGGVE